MSAIRAAAIVATAQRHSLPPVALRALLELLARTEDRSATTIAMSCRELGAELRVSASTACRSVRRLRDTGLVEAHPDPRHRAPTVYDVRAAVEACR